jgi:hypothetical protein
VGPPDAGDQLCRPLRPASRPTLPSDPGIGDICASEDVRCVDKVVRVCERVGQPVRAIGVCIFGCHPAGIVVDHGEAKDLDGILTILCRRDDAERR